MSTSRFVLVVLAAAAGAASALLAVQAARADPTEIKVPEGTPPEMVEMMKKYLQAATPGEQHKQLAKGLGTWDGVVKMWQDPATPPAESRCVTKVVSMMGGRFTKSETTGEMPGMGPFEGFGVYGYDNVGKTYQSVWLDTLGTGMSAGTGALSPDHKTMTWTMKFNDAGSGQETEMKEIERYVSDNAMVLEFYGPGPDGKEFKMMQIEYTKRAGAAPAAPAGGASKEPSK
jgi:hypothetical protein